VRFGHPWIFSGALVGAPQTAGAALADILSSRGELLGQGFYTPHARLAVRMLTQPGEQPFSSETIRRRLAAAIERRRHLFTRENNSARLVFAESDFLPGLIVDQFDGMLSVQLNSAFADHYREEILAGLNALLKPKIIFDTSDNEARNREGLKPVSRIHSAEETAILSGGIRYATHIGAGQKTGFYLDQRTNRAVVASHAAGCRVLDAFCYSGGFTLACAKAGATAITAIDSSADALALFARNLELNAHDLPQREKISAVQADVFEELRRLKAAGEKFDLIVLDPPKLAPSRSKAAAAEKAYKDLNLQALHLAAPGALLATFSCSGAMTFDKLRQVLHYAAHDAGKQLQILQPLVQAEDHPVLLAFPESEYLRGYLCRVY
jgi:23S rRNA (cytosine1962-C5)-methyltransferase